MVVELRTCDDKKIQLYNNVGKIHNEGTNLVLYYVEGHYERLLLKVQFRKLLLFRVVDDTTYFS